MVVDKGRIIERGRHDELVQARGLYSGMWETYSRSRDWSIDIRG